MSTNTTIQSVILVPSSTFEIICSDGLSYNDIQNIKKIYNFGGNIKITECGGKIDEQVLYKSWSDMGLLEYKYKNLYGQ